MANLSVLQLADRSLLPLLVFITTRYTGIFLAALLFPIRFELANPLNFDLLPFLLFPTTSDLVIANTFSWAFTSLVFAIYLGFLLFRNFHLNIDLIHPKEAGFVYKKNLQFVLVGLEEALHQNLALLLTLAAALSWALRDLLDLSASPVVLGLIIAEAVFSLLFVQRFFAAKAKLGRDEVQEEDYDYEPENNG